jgi:beta-aspartyl-peptidase (threonine type)
MPDFTPSLIVHGGAWDIPDADVAADLEGCRHAAEIGWAILQNGPTDLGGAAAALKIGGDIRIGNVPRAAMHD